MSAQRLRDAAAHVRLTTDQYPPGVGLALADWLEKAATEWEVWGEHDRNIDQPLVVADLILGGTQ